MWFLCMLFVFLNLLDLATTFELMRVCGENIEANPIPSFFYELGGYWGMGLHKAFMTIWVIAISVYIYHHKKAYSYFVLGLGCSVLLLVVIYNLTLRLMIS
jgi:hypothetical protein